MIIIATEFKTYFGKYLDMLISEDIFITLIYRSCAFLFYQGK